MTHTHIKIKLSISVVIRHIILSNSSPLEQFEYYNIHKFDVKVAVHRDKFL